MSNYFESLFFRNMNLWRFFQWYSANESSFLGNFDIKYSILAELRFIINYLLCWFNKMPYVGIVVKKSRLYIFSRGRCFRKSSIRHQNQPAFPTANSPKLYFAIECPPSTFTTLQILLYKSISGFFRFYFG